MAKQEVSVIPVP